MVLAKRNACKKTGATFDPVRVLAKFTLYTNSALQDLLTASFEWKKELTKLFINSARAQAQVEKSCDTTAFQRIVVKSKGMPMNSDINKAELMLAVAGVKGLFAY